jgi:hypothetical protein
LRGTGVPRYADLVARACTSIGVPFEDLRGYRVQAEYPLPGTQYCMSFPAQE